MDFSTARSWVLGLTDHEKSPSVVYSAANFNLQRVERLLSPLGAPHLGPLTVHIAGTKGKGSTAAMVASILSAAGYKTGLYTSPHLLSICERVQVDGKPMSEQDFAEFIGVLKPVAEEVTEHGGLGKVTTFEVLTALGFLYFHRQGVDAQVLEVGLGGRLDATNVCQPAICVITSLSLDHTDILGETLEQIAQEKAGIIKAGVPVVSAPQPPDAQTVIEKTCQQVGAPLTCVGRDVRFRQGRASQMGQEYIVSTPTQSLVGWIPLLGVHQVENAACAIAAIDILNHRGVPRPITDHHIREGLKSVHWPGRMEVLRRSPLLVVDGAHNTYSIRCLTQAIKATFTFRNVILVVGVSSNKDWKGMIEGLAELNPHRILVTRSTHPRAAPAEALQQAFQSHGLDAQQADSVDEALRVAFSLAHPDDLVLVTGSLFVVADALGYTPRSEKVGAERT